MSSNASQQFEDSLWQLLEHFGEAAVYQAAGGDPVNVTVGALLEQTLLDPGPGDGQEANTNRDVILTRDPASTYGGVECPELDATMCIGGREYAVKGIALLGQSFSRLTLWRGAKKEISRGKYRRSG